MFFMLRTPQVGDGAERHGEVRCQATPDPHPPTAPSRRRLGGVVYLHEGATSTSSSETTSAERQAGAMNILALTNQAQMLGHA